jgi:hypothetical protein
MDSLVHEICKTKFNNTSQNCCAQHSIPWINNLQLETEDRELIRQSMISNIIYANPDEIIRFPGKIKAMCDLLPVERRASL